GMMVVDPSVKKNWDPLVLEDIKTRLAGVQSKSFNTQTNIATEKIFYVPAAAPRVIASDIMVVSAKHRIAFAGALYDVDQRRIRSEFGVGERIGAPEIHIPFAIAVPLRAGRHVRDLLHFFSRIFPRMAIGRVGIVTEPRGHGGFGFGAFTTEEPGKGNKDISHRRIVRATKQR